MSRKKAVLLSVAILLAAAVLLVVIFRTEPEAKRSGATRETAMLVDVVEAERGTFRPTVVAMGTVLPARDVVLGPRVSGEVVERSPAFVPGGFVPRGEVLVRIDPADYRNALARRRSELRQALSDLDLEKGRQDVARQDYELLRETVQPEDEGLVLRQPQMEAARARVEAARAAVERAELDLQRTTVRAPFDAHVLARQVEVGSQVAPGDPLGRLVGTDEYWVEVAVPQAKLRFLSIPDGAGRRGSPVRVRNRSAWPADVYRSGQVDQLLGELAGQTRMARVLVTVSDPLAREGGPTVAAGPGGSGSDGVGYSDRGRLVADGAVRPPLMIGSYLEAEIEAEALPGVVRLDRDHLRGDDTVWVMEDGRLRIRDVEVVFRDARHAYVASGLEDGDLVVTTNLSTVVDGASLRLEGEGGASPGSQGADGGGRDNGADGDGDGDSGNGGEGGDDGTAGGASR